MTILQKMDKAIQKNNFIGIPENWDSHRPLLYEALNATEGDVIEFGMGKGSTQQLHDFCLQNNRNLFSYEFDLDYYNQFKKLHSETHKLEWRKNWDEVFLLHYNCDVLFIDHSPGERRKVDIKLWADKARIIIAHDTELENDHGYQMREELNKFKFIFDHKTHDAWTTAVSNEIDVTKFIL